MQLNSKVYLRNREDPILISEAGARNMEKAFLDGKIPYDQQMGANGISFTKSEIKRIEITPDGSNNPYENRRPHWIIYNKIKNLIWEKPYMSRQDAEAEIRYSGLSTDWAIEQC